MDRTKVHYQEEIKKAVANSTAEEIKLLEQKIKDLMRGKIIVPQEDESKQIRQLKQTVANLITERNNL